MRGKGVLYVVNKIKNEKIEKPRGVVIYLYHKKRECSDMMGLSGAL